MPPNPSFEGTCAKSRAGPSIQTLGRTPMTSATRSCLSSMVEKPFLRWVSCETWYKGHPADDERFYRFVWVVAQFSRRPPTEATIRDLIISKWGGKLESAFLESQALHYSQQYVTLLEFAKVRNKPVPFLASEVE